MKLQPILRGIRRADQDFHLIEPGDHLALGLSGGKDSMLLFLALSIYQRFEGKDFQLTGIHIDFGLDAQATEMMRAFAAEHDLDLQIVDSKIFDILNLEQNMKNGKIQCSLCSTLKKGTLIDTALQSGCNKLVLGHHGDDAVETLLLNMIHGGRMATFRVRQFMSRTGLTVIRPMVYLRESEIVEACRINSIPRAKPVCPNDGFSQRQEMKELLDGLYRQYPMAHDNFFKALVNRDQDILWQIKEKDETQ